MALSFKQSKYIVIALAVLYFTISFSLCVFKYTHFLYNVFDLGIFNQILHNTINGDFLRVSLHHSNTYFGDHFSPLFLVLIPIYYIFQSPFTLLFLQSLFIALAAWPLYKIAKKHLSPPLTLFICILYLFNPLIITIGLFEFHVLPFVLFFGLWTFYFYDQKKFIKFTVFSLALLLVREDVALLVFGFGLLALIQKRSLKWIILPLISSLLYLYIALKAIAFFVKQTSNKFLVYFAWLGSSEIEIVKNIFFKPLHVFQRLFSSSSFVVIVGSITNFLFLPLFRLRYLIIALPTFILYVFSTRLTSILLRAHYGSVFILTGIIASIFALKQLQSSSWIKNYFNDTLYKPLFYIIPAAALLYLNITLGPYTALYRYSTNSTWLEKTEARQEFVRLIPDNASVISGYEFFPHLSSRKNLYALNFVFIGKEQFSEAPYQYDTEPDYIIFDFEELFTYHLQDDALKAGLPYAERIMIINDLLANYNIVDSFDTLYLFGKEGAKATLFTKSPMPPANNSASKIIITTASLTDKDKEILLSISALAPKIPEKNYQLKLSFLDENEQSIQTRYLPLAHGLYPTMAWDPYEAVTTHFTLQKPDHFDQVKRLQMDIVDVYGGLAADNLWVAIPLKQEEKIITSSSLSL